MRQQQQQQRWPVTSELGRPQVAVPAEVAQAHAVQGADQHAQHKHQRLAQQSHHSRSRQNVLELSVLAAAARGCGRTLNGRLELGEQQLRRGERRARVDDGPVEQNLGRAQTRREIGDIGGSDECQRLGSAPRSGPELDRCERHPGGLACRVRAHDAKRLFIRAGPQQGGGRQGVGGKRHREQAAAVALTGAVDDHELSHVSRQERPDGVGSGGSGGGSSGSG